MIREQRKRKKRRKIRLIVLSVFLLAVTAAVLIIWNVFTVSAVVVEGNDLYSDEQIEKLVLNDEYSWNSLYVNLKYRILDVGDVPFVDAVEVSLDDPHTVRIAVYEKGILGCFYIDAIGQYAYFDKDGFVVETSTEEITDVPVVSGIACDSVVLYEKLPLDNEQVLQNLLNLTQTLKKYNLLPQEIYYDEKTEPTLTYYGTRVMMGTDEYLSQKVVRLSAIMPQLSGLYGTLHMETWTPDTTGIIYERDE